MNENILGLDKFQKEIIKQNYKLAKPVLAKKEKVAAKITEINQKFQAALVEANKELEVYNQQLGTLDSFAIEITKKTCGFALTTEEVIKFLENPQAFIDYKKEMMGDDMFEEENQWEGSATETEQDITQEEVSEREAAEAEAA